MFKKRLSAKSAGTVLITCALFAGGCATPQTESQAYAPMNEADSPTSGALVVAKSTGKGALRGAGVCAMPTVIGLYGGPIGLVIGGYISIVCMPIGVTLGALVGAAYGIGENAAQSNATVAEESPLREARID